VQSARQAGAGCVVATVGHADKVAAAQALGAHHVVVAADPAWPEVVLRLTDGRGVDVAREASGGPALAETLRCLAAFGRLAVFGAASGRAAGLDAPTLERWLYAPARNQSVVGFNVGDRILGRPQEAGAVLVGDVAAGRIATPPLTVLPLSEARHAHDLLETRRSPGKLALDPWA
jgi:NADPH2:quinone reductase